MKHFRQILIFSTVFLISTTILGSDYSAYFNAVQNAYTDYRMALFQSNKGRSTEARDSMEQFIDQWSAILDKYLDDPPCVYAADPLWSKSLTEIKSIMQEGLSAAEADDLSHAHEIIERIRDVLGDLRHRNHVIAFSDYVNKYHTQMEYVINVFGSEEEFSPQERLSLREALAVLRYLGKEMEANAPVRYTHNPQFSELLNTNFDAINQVVSSLNSPESLKLKNAIKRLKPVFSMFFINFG